MLLLCENIDPQGDRILVFATDANLVKLCASEMMFSDGTFHSCSTLFTQLYILYAKVNGTVFPLVFGLLSNKTEDTYERFSTLLKNAVHERPSMLTPGHWILDSEVAAHNAIRASFLLTSTKGCFFHYTQRKWRKVQSTGLEVTFREDEYFHQLVRRATVVPLVPENIVENVL
ncbi:uncharacterized protein LOC125679874 [Ostrea edulis]|uniref:uncharacterized protein LOC125679874 n=1 Tax=Ostrea edulis TaxID=37623 RepID=UPI0024AF8D50|nr:uncharacterized protein LOC125679874 [Ostrea edulis]